MCDHTIVVIWVTKIFLYISSVYSCHFLISSASVRSTQFLSFIVPKFIFPLVSLIFLKRSLVFPHQLFSSISLHWSLRKAFLSLLAILWNSAFRWFYLPFLLWLQLLFFSQLFCKASSDNHLAFCISFSWVLFENGLLYNFHETLFIAVQALCLSDPISWICHLNSIILRYLIRSYLYFVMVLPTSINLSLNFTINSSWSEPQSAPSLVFAYSTELLHLWLPII